MNLDRPLVPIDDISGPLRGRVDLVAGLGGDLSFYRWAANALDVADFYWGDFYRDLFFRGVLPVRTKELVRLRLAGISGCAFCSAGDRASALQHGVNEAEIDAAFTGRVIESFDEHERAALTVATAVAAGTSGACEELLTLFMPAEAVELVVVAGVLAGIGRMLAAIGFLDARCAVPEG